ncbi:MAG: hypothetical protein ACLQNE_09845 [Thermoguttaceae bacterium]
MNALHTRCPKYSSIATKHCGSVDSELSITAISSRANRQIQAKLRSLFNLRMRVTVCPPGTLPRFEMKAQRWVREAVAEQ